MGKDIPRTDAYEKVTGRAIFGADLKFSEMLFTAQKRINSAHAKIKNIKISEALKVEGIKTIVTYKDIPGENLVGTVKNDQPIFAHKKVRYPGDVIALVVGKNRQAVQTALKKIEVDYKELPVLSNPQNALDKDAPLIHPENGTNQIVHYPLRKGDVEKGFQQADFILEKEYSTQFVEHAYVEPEVVIAVPDYRKDVYKIYGSIQNPFTTRRIVARVMNLSLNKIRIIQSEIGGSFGGKDDIMNILAARACVACKKVGKPVKIVLTREESIQDGYKRHPYFMNYKVGFLKSGRVISMKIDILADGGAYVSMSPFVTWRSVVQATGPYQIENISTDVLAVYTNNPYTGAMRGFGSPQIIFAQESLMDEIAEKLELNPIEIRKINGYKRNSFTASNQKLNGHKVSLFEVIEKAVSESDFLKKYERNKKSIPKQLQDNSKFEQNKFILKDKNFLIDSKTKFKGIGLACSFRGCSLGAEGVDATGAMVSILNDGSVYLLSGLAENGQGLRTTFSIIVAEIFGINPEDIYYLEQDTGTIPDGGPTVASRSTLVGGEASKNAAEKVQKRIENILIKEWHLKGKIEFVFENYQILEKNSQKKISFSDACMLAYQNGINLAAYGWFKAPDVSWDEKKGRGPAYFTYVYGCQVAEVEVDITTGKVFVENITAVHDIGKIINKLGAEGQVFGGTTMGAGYGILEEIIVKKGKIQNLNFNEYLIPTSLDVGKIKAIFLENTDKFGPWGAKSLGEPTLELTAAAINNAASNAIGKRFYNLPLDLEQIKLGKCLYEIKKNYVFARA
ncbi:MAG: xanthine dehydrogenase family protein [Candidatus Cloacimonetes bacterium]|nr:xanthine dehydrogenase family protein [Candidatus Cloacimonadota bacterium]